jgi:hypothetical protein
MPDTDPILCPIQHARDVLMSDGYGAERVAEAMISLGLADLLQDQGARTVSQRLWLMARQIAVEADRLEGITVMPNNGSVN